MPGKDFEQKVRDQLADFSLGSVPEVWPEINAALHPNKKRRLPPWFFIIMIAVLGGISLIWYNIPDHQNETVVKNETRKNESGQLNDSDLELKQDLSLEKTVIQKTNKLQDPGIIVFNKNNSSLNATGS